MSSSVRPSVCRLSVLSVTFVHPTQAIEIFGNIFISYERPFILVFWEEDLLVGGDPFHVKFWVNRPLWTGAKSPIFNRFARSSSAVTLSEKSSIKANRKSTTRFPMSLRWSSYVAPKSTKGAQKRKTADFCVKSHFAWRKSARKFLCVTRNSPGDEIANVKFLYDDIVHVLQNTIDSCITPQIDSAVMCGTHVYQIQWNNAM